MVILFGDRLTPTASLTALVAVGTAVAAMTAVSSQILVAVGRTWHVGLAWTLALAVAALAFAAPVAAADVRIGLAFLAGEITALVLVTASPSARAPTGSGDAVRWPTTEGCGDRAARGRRVAVVLGTRPEIIKLAEVIRLLGDSACVVYTGQHYDDRLGPAFFRELELPPRTSPSPSAACRADSRSARPCRRWTVSSGSATPGGRRPGRHELRGRRRDRSQRP